MVRQMSLISNLFINVNHFSKNMSSLCAQVSGYKRQLILWIEIIFAVLTYCACGARLVCCAPFVIRASFCN
jgi:hypothetical protein